MSEIKVGDKVRLRRRYSNLNGWSIRPDLDGQIVEIIKVDPQGGGPTYYTAKHGETRLGFFKDALGEVIA